MQDRALDKNLNYHSIFVVVNSRQLIIKHLIKAEQNNNI